MKSQRRPRPDDDVPGPIAALLQQLLWQQVELVRRGDTDTLLNVRDYFTLRLELTAHLGPAVH